MTRLFVGGLPFSTTEDDLSRIFGAYGPVKECILIMDKETGRSRGFSFVEMESDLDALKAEEALDQSELGGRRISVRPAQPRRGRNNA
jgi:RNA recognition motif-containing protein